MARQRHWQVRLQSTDPAARNRDIFSYPIFSFFVGVQRQYITGRVRSLLNETQKARWDYFFRPNLKMIDDIDRQTVRRLEGEVSLVSEGLEVLSQAEHTLLHLNREREDICRKLESARGNSR